MKLFLPFFKIRASFLTVLLVLGLSPMAVAQRTIGAKTLILDDGAGNAVTLQTAPGATGTFTFPNGGGTVATQGFLSSNYLPLAGGIMTGDINMNSHNITNGGSIAATGFSGSGASLTSLTGGNITAGTVTGTQLAANAVSAAKMADDGTTGNVLTSNNGTPHWVAQTSFTPAYLYTSATSSNFVVPNATSVNMAINTTAGFVPLGSGLFSVISTGIYKIDWTIELGGDAATYYGFALEQNGTPVANFDCINSTSVSGSAILPLSAGDVIGLYNISGVDVDLTAKSPGTYPAHLSVVLIH